MEAERSRDNPQTAIGSYKQPFLLSIRTVAWCAAPSLPKLEKLSYLNCATSEGLSISMAAE